MPVDRPSQDPTPTPAPSSASAAPPDGSAAPSDQDDVALLKARIAALEEELVAARSTAATIPIDPGRAGGPGPGTRGPRSGRWRPVAAAVLIALVVPLAMASVVARWAHREVGDTDRYVATVAPLASDPAVQRELADRVTAAIFERFDVQAVTQEAVDAIAEVGLPERAVTTLDALVPPLVTGIETFVRNQVTAFIRSDTFQQAWVAANRQAHGQMVAVLTGEGSETVSVQGGRVSVNLAAVIATVKTQLIARGFTLAERIPAVNAQFTLFDSPDLAKARSAFALLSTVALVLPVLTLLLLGAAVFVARDRRRALIGGALAVAGGMLLLGVSLNVVRPIYLNHVPPEILSTEAAAAIFDALVHYLRLGLRIVLVVALVVVLVAWLTGPSTLATGTRRRTTSAARTVAAAATRAGAAGTASVETGAAGTFAREHLIALRLGIGGVAVLLYAVADHPGAGYALTLLVLAVLAALVVEFLARTAPGAAEGTVEGGGPA